MKLLWDFPEEYHVRLVGIALSKYGTVVRSLSSPHSSIYTFDLGASSVPRYMVAKGIRISDSMAPHEKRKCLMRVLHEVNNAHLVCHHPSIQRFFDVQLVYGIPFLLSRMRDATLLDVIAERPLPAAEVLSIAIQIVHALNHCADRGLVCHQDLKPENVFVDVIRAHFAVPADYPLRRRTFIGDFELANAYRTLRHPFGSRPYMAPEQYRLVDGEPVDEDFSRVDVFALGVLIFEMLTGGLHPVGKHTRLIWPKPAAGESRKWLREDPWKRWLETGAPISTTDQELDPAMIDIVRSCLMTDPGRRISKRTLEALLMERLEHANSRAHQALGMLLTQFDDAAREGEQLGWPYYAERVQQLNEVLGEPGSQFLSNE